ncbi:MAG: hypothetical protein F4227_04900 [Gammaproteobacteria bacterium]|nr:hypothetical protein [Gammaproteobacteria bacterium]MYF02306.1 hypothetical protein [Gammaproteobacteria bacterium]
MNVAKAEVRTARRRARFWTIVFFLSLFSIMGYLISCSYLGYAALTSPSFGTGVPKYLLGNIDPTFFLFFQFAVLFLAFDAGHLHNRDRIIEVLDSKSITNFEYLAGRVFGIAGLLWLVAAANIFVMQLLGLVSTTTNIGIAETIEWYSLINLLVIDGPATLLFWCSIVVFLSCVLHFRLLVVVVASTLMFGWFFLFLNTPYSLLEVVSPSSNDTLFVSDLLPQLASIHVIGLRVATILAAMALVAVGGLIWRRQKSVSKRTWFYPLGTCLCAGILLYTFGLSVVINHHNTAENWREVHANHEWDHRIDLVAITGTVTIDPRKHLFSDLSLSFQTTTDSSGSLVFTFNPSMDIDELFLNGNEPDWTFGDGLLTVSTQVPLDLDAIHTLDIIAFGVPDEKFAYFDSAFDYLRTPGITNQTISLLGSKGSIYSSKYVALMPGVYWYPIPGPARGDYRSSNQGLDYFHLDLTVELTPNHWQLVGTDSVVRSSDQTNAYRVSPTSPVHQISLFASEFESASAEVEGIEFKIFLHKQHADNLKLQDEFVDKFEDLVKWRLQDFSDHGLTLPFRTLTLVEVPRQLRTVGGGWCMNSLQTLPGMVLMKEHGFPSARMDLALERLTNREHDEDSVDEEQMKLLFEYFWYGMGTDNPWMGLPERLWSHRVSARGEYANALDQIALSLIASLQRRNHEFFSIHSTVHFADLTALSFFEGTVGLEDGLENDRVPSTIGTARRLRENYATRVSVWNNVEDTSFTDLPSAKGNQHDFELLLLKCDRIANALMSVNGEEKVFAWLVDILTQHAGQTYTLENLISSAETHEVMVDPFLTEWLQTNSLPAFEASNYTTARITDDAQGNPRYLTSVSVRNTQPVAGFVRLQFPTEQSWDWPRPYLTESKGVRIDGGSAKRINLLTSYEIRSVYVDAGLSLHRGLIQLTQGSETSEIPTNMEPADFAEASSWMPIKEIGIIVDDLDTGFTVEQKSVRTARPPRAGPIAWFRIPRLDGELDRGIPVRGDYLFEYRAPAGEWNRIAESQAYGKFRRTAVFNYVRQTNRTATFTTELPDSAVWQLDYHVPVSLNRDGHKGLKYQMQITDQTGSQHVDFDVYNLEIGWNSVGEYDLDAGEVKINLVGTSQRGPLWADAIRWSKVEMD